MSNNTTKKYTQDVDTALFAFSILKKLNSGEVKTFDDRLRSQKIQYIAQFFDVSPSYNFSLYIHGPYSPALANDLFALHEEGLSPDFTDFVPQALKERFEKLSEFIDKKTNRDLELIATLHLFSRLLRYPEDRSVVELKKFKKATDEEVTYSFAELSKIPC